MLIKGLPDLFDPVISALSMIVSDLMNHNLGLSLIECCLHHLTCEQNSVSAHGPYAVLIFINEILKSQK